MTEQSYNTDLLMQVREKIVNEPEKHEQSRWARAFSDPRKGGDCGTAYCVAGWAAVLDGQKLAWIAFGDFWEASVLIGGVGISPYAMETLGLSMNEARRLFAGDNPRTHVLSMLDRLIEAGKNGERVPSGDLGR